MAHFKIYAHSDFLKKKRETVSTVLHACACEALGLPPDKKFHRFIGLDSGDFIYPKDRSHDYTIIEISMFVGRTTDTKKQLIRLLFAKLKAEAGLEPQDVEITITETPRENWGIRGVPGDELNLTYRVEK